MSDNDNKSGNENCVEVENNKNDNNNNNKDNNINEDNNNSFEENNSSYVGNDNKYTLNDIIEEVETKSKKKKKIGKGSEFLHILPCKISNESNIIFAPVDEFFEKKIIENTDKNSDNYQYNAHFRGRLLNGRKYTLNNNNNENNNINIHYYELEQNSKNQSEYKINLERSINTYFLWKYDEIFENDSNTFMNIHKILNDLNCLS
jgi:hypothetical protein